LGYIINLIGTCREEEAPKVRTGLKKEIKDNN